MLEQAAAPGAPKQREALVQLGLAALAADDREGAERFLQSTEEPVPSGALYLRALLADRAGASPEAEETLTRLADHETGTGGSVYAVAARRLLGSAAERHGQHHEAGRRYRQALAAWPGDPAATVRLLRNELRERYAALSGGCESSVRDEAHSDMEAASGVGFGRFLVALNQWLDVASADGGGGTPPPLPEDGDPMALGPSRRLVLRALFAGGGTAEAAAWLAQCPEQAGGDPLLIALGALLPHLASLRTAWEGRATEADRRALRELQMPDAGGLADAPLLPLWRLAVQLALDPQGPMDLRTLLQTVEPEHQPEQASLIAALGLFAAGVAQRQAAAELWHRASFPPERLPAGLATVLTALAAYVAGDDGAFLQHYAELETAWPEHLPCSEEGLFLAAGRARVRANDLAPLTDSGGFIPPTLTALASPEVRELLGLAYARSAALDPNHSLPHLEQSLDFLTSLQKEPET